MHSGGHNFQLSAQTVVAWSNHRRHGHKHADEPSLHIWSRGYNWITATGYWPYGLEGFDEANGWAGSNAPHALKESANSPRQARLLGIGNDGPLRVAGYRSMSPLWNVRSTPSIAAIC